MTDEFIIYIAATADGSFSNATSQYLLSFSVHDPMRRGYITTTKNATQAKRFESQRAAFEFWQQQHGLRDDGKPNRPLTAFTVEVLPLSASCKSGTSCC